MLPAGGSYLAESGLVGERAHHEWGQCQSPGARHLLQLQMLISCAVHSAKAAGTVSDHIVNHIHICLARQSTDNNIQ